MAQDNLLNSTNLKIPQYEISDQNLRQNFTVRVQSNERKRSLASECRISLARVEFYEYTQLFSKPSIAMLNTMKFKNRSINN